jgi:Uncharacterized protein conserved in bacteria (DUF2330)
MRTILLAVALAIILLQPTVAHACGGCFHGESQNPTVVTDHRMILSLSVGQTTLYDQIEYSGSPDSFAWVLPIAGTATVGLSADLVFDVLDTLTHTTINAPAVSCPAPPSDCQTPAFNASADAGVGSVQVLTSQVVGPYETVQLASSDPQALNNWLSANGFAVPADVQPIVDAYVGQGFNFLAMKLVPGAGIQAMRPVRVTTQGASPVLPLRMVAAGAGSSVGVTLWIIGEGRYEPQNFPFFRIQDSQIVWDWNTMSSNYTALRQSTEQSLNNAAWEVESSLPLDVTAFTQMVDMGGNPYAYDAGTDYQSIPAQDGGDGGGETATQVRNDDLATLLAGIDPSSARVTRIRSDLARAALGQDLLLQASGDQSQLTNVRTATSSIGTAPACPSFQFCDPSGKDAGDSLSEFGASGCSAAQSREAGGNLTAFLASLGIAMVYRVARRRKR